MGKHKSRDRSRSPRDRHERRKRHRDDSEVRRSHSHDSLRKRKSRERSRRPSRSSRSPHSTCNQPADESALRRLLEETLEALHRQDERLAALEEAKTPPNLNGEDCADIQVVTDSGEKENDPGNKATDARNVTFVAEVVEDTAGEFFGPPEKPPSEFVWAQSAFTFVKNTVSSGLSEEDRQQLLAKYKVKDDLEILGPPKLNKLLVPALKATASVIKRDEYQVQSQTQVGACLNAMGSAMSELLKPTIKQALPEDAQVALRRLADGIYLLADHQHRLSLARRAFIKPTLSLLGKHVADNAPVDEWLFGSSFADELKDAQSCEKAAKDLLKTTVVTKPALQPSRTNSGKQQNQPVKHHQQQQQQQKWTGNAKTPAYSRNAATRYSGGFRSRSRSRRSASRPRTYRR